MNYQEELNNWNNFFVKNFKIKKDLNKLRKVDEKDSHFFNDLKILNNLIYGSYGAGYNKINSITLKKIIDIFNLLIDNKNDNYFLISSDGSNECVEMLKDIIWTNDKDIKFITFSNFVGFDKKFISATIKKIHPYASIYISRSIYDKTAFEINLFDEQGFKINKEILKGILKQLDKNINNISRDEKRKISFLNNDSLIKIFNNKINVLFPKNINNKKTKIAISNRSNGITNILTKLIGNQDFTYVVNEKINNQKIDIFEKKYVSDKKIKTFFKNDIKFAKKYKCNFLITFNENGTQLFVFIIHRNKVIYLNENLLVLTFLHKFYIELVFDNKTLSNLFISSNEGLNDNLSNLVKKYNIKWRMIKNENFVSKDYLLIYWNDYAQYIFGEKINDEYTIYHLLIKVLAIIDYYNNQWGSTKTLFSKLEKIYGSFDIQNKHLIDLNYEEAKKRVIVFISKYSKLVKSELETNTIDELAIEDDIWNIRLVDNTKIIIKYNKLMKKTIVVFRRKRETNLIKEIFSHKLYEKLMVKKIFDNN